MKRCPKCLRSYSDNSLKFCLEDGTPLATEVSGSPIATGPDPEATLISPVSPASPITPQRASIHPRPIQSTDSPSRWVLVAGLILLAVLLGGAAVAFLYRLNKWDSPANGGKPVVQLATPAPKPSRQALQPTAEPTPLPGPSLTGQWTMVNTVEKTSFPLYANLRLGYRLTITQTGTEFSGEGEKVTENGRTMEAFERTPIHITGSVYADGVRATFVEEGLRRKTGGRFVWTTTADGNQLRGSFVSTAAKSSGASVATRE